MTTMRTAMGDDITSQQDGSQAAADIWLPIDPDAPPDDDGMILSQPVTSEATPALDAAPGATVSSLLPNATALQEVSFLTGLNANGTLTTNSFWGANASIAHKWGSSGAGTAGGTLTYVFDPASNFTATERTTFQCAFSMWSAVANVQFAETTSSTGASVLLHRGSDRSAYETDGGHLTSNGSGLATHTGQSMISIDTSVNGFDLSGSFDKVGGYGFQTAVHEIGHLLGLGHGGDYNGNVNPATDQYGPYDERSWTLMSYIYWQQSNAKFAANYEVKGVNWGSTGDGYYLQSSTTWMPLDILAVQRIYGVPSSSALPGGQVFGFNTNITGDLKNSFDFIINSHPVVTLYDTGTGNTLDLSGFSRPSTILLSPGSFSSVNGEVGDIAIAYGTQIDAAIGGSGNDTIVGNANDNLLTGGLGNDKINGGDGIDTARFSGQASAYTLSKAGAVYTIVGPDGTDTLTNVENLQFGSAAPIAIDSLLPSASFNFSFATAKVVFYGSAVSISGSDGTTTTVTGIHVYNFTDGTINEDQGSPLVDDLYYLANNKDVWAAKLDPETHYDTYGYMEDRDPNAFFSTKGYLGANSDVKAAGLNPLLHYDALGWHEGRDPSGSFDTGLYLLHNPDVNAAGVDPLLHFIKSGQAEGRAASAAIGAPGTHGSFDAEYYLLKNPDVAASVPSGANAAEFAFEHYDLLGWHEMRDPNAFFSTSGYLNAYKDVAAANLDPLTHYDGPGWKEGRDPSTSFDTKQYLGAYMDVRNAGVDPLTHYLASGANEGRSTFSDGKFG